MLSNVEPPLQYATEGRPYASLAPYLWSHVGYRVLATTRGQKAVSSMGSHLGTLISCEEFDSGSPRALFCNQQIDKRAFDKYRMRVCHCTENTCHCLLGPEIFFVGGKNLGFQSGHKMCTLPKNFEKAA